MKPSRSALIAAVLVGGAYGASLLSGSTGDGLSDAVLLLGVLGVAFPALAWLLTRRQYQHRLPAPNVSPPSMLALLGYLTLFALFVLGWGFSALNQLELSNGAHDSAKLAVKLLTMVALPLLLFGKPWQKSNRKLADRRRNVFALVVLGIGMLAFQAIAGRGLQTLGALQPSAATLLWAIPGCFLWQVLEAGLCEEILFRRILQERIAGATGSQVAAVLWSSLLFGLAHAPGLYMRGGNLMEGVAIATPAWALAYSVAMIAPAGLLFGVLWARTRCLWLVVLLHGAVDLLPQLAPFLGTWAGLTPQT